jgi:hypothetical protein
MPPIVRTAQGTNSGSATAISFSPIRPAGRLTGDLNLYIVYSSSTTAPTRPGTVTGLRSIVDAAFHMDICYQTEAAQTQPIWTKGTACKWAGAVLCVQAGTFDTVTTFDVENGANQTGAAATLYTTPSITVGVTDCLLVAAFGNAGASTWTAAAQTPVMVEAVDTTASSTTPASMCVYHSSTNQVPTGAITRQATATVSSADACMWAATIRPASSTPSPNRWSLGNPPGTRYIRQALQQATNY